MTKYFRNFGHDTSTRRKNKSKESDTILFILNPSRPVPIYLWLQKQQIMNNLIVGQNVKMFFPHKIC